MHNTRVFIAAFTHACLIPAERRDRDARHFYFPRCGAKMIYHDITIYAMTNAAALRLLRAAKIAYVTFYFPVFRFQVLRPQATRS